LQYSGAHNQAIKARPESVGMACMVSPGRQCLTVGRKIYLESPAKLKKHVIASAMYKDVQMPREAGAGSGQRGNLVI
jgi:hypothetical protein